MKMRIKFIWILAINLATLLGVAPAFASGAYDLVIEGGRVMDPETGFDALRNVGIRAGRIEIITEGRLDGVRVIDARGLVVAPGFIDTHVHGTDPFAIKMALRDGVTTALELEGGVINTSDWYAARENAMQVNYGATVGHAWVRMLVHDPEVKIDGPVDFTVAANYLETAAKDGVPGWSVNRNDTVQLNTIVERIDEELRQGALGVGIALSYMARGADSYEVLAVQRAAARYGRVSMVHTRYHHQPKPPTEATLAFDEVFANAVALRAPLLVAHNNSYGWDEIAEKLQLARAQGFNMWSEHYPYHGGSTFVGAEELRPELWLDRMGYTYEQTLYDPKTDRYLDRAGYEDLASRDPGQTVLTFHPPRQRWIPYWLSMPHMTVASDGMPGVGTDGKLLPWAADYTDYAGHPRTAGTRARTLRLGREYGVPLMHTLAQLSYWSAVHLGDTGLKSMQERGRMQEGMVADVTIFDPQTVTDHADYTTGSNGLPSTGISWVIVNGTVVVGQGEVLEGVFPGQAIRYPVEAKGRFEPISEEKWIREFTIRDKPLEGDVGLSHIH